MKGEKSDVTRGSGASELDGVEVKVTVPGLLIDRAVEVCGLELEQGERRQVYFCDSPDATAAGLILLDQGIILRLRAGSDGHGDSTVKFRPFDPDGLRDRWRDRQQGDTEIRVEGDWVGDRHCVAASAVASQDAEEVRRAADGTRRFAKLLSRRQEEFLADNASIKVALDGLRVAGPIDALKWKRVPLRLSKELVAERWEVGELRFLELSLRVDTERRAEEAQRELTNVMANHGLLGDGKQETKTRMVLEYCLHVGGV